MRSLVQPALFEDRSPGLYPATFLGREGPKEGKFSEFIVWKFSVMGEDAPQEYTGISSTNFTASNKSKGYRWAQAIDPNLNPDTPEWDDEDFIGAPVTISLVDQDDPPSGWLKVGEVFPAQS